MMSLSILFWMVLAVVPLLREEPVAIPRATSANAETKPKGWEIDDPQQFKNADALSEDVPTAEAMLEALRRYRPPKAAIAPVGGTANRGINERDKLWPEGTTVISRPGRLARLGNWWLFSWIDESGDPPVRLLPNAVLEQMVRTTDHGTHDVALEVTGEFAVFQGTNYLLATLAARLGRSMAQQNDDPPLPPDAPPEESARTSVKEPTTDPTSRTIGDASVEDVLDMLEKQKPRRRVLPVTDSPGGEMNRMPRRVVPWAPIPDGSPISRRPGRVVREGDWWTFVYESDTPDRPEPPMKLLPNLSVERMVSSVTDEGEAGLVFLVSGEVTAFLGENYLLTHAAIRRAETGNLRR